MPKKDKHHRTSRKKRKDTRRSTRHYKSDHKTNDVYLNNVSDYYNNNVYRDLANYANYKNPINIGGGKEVKEPENINVRNPNRPIPPLPAGQNRYVNLCVFILPGAVILNQNQEVITEPDELTSVIQNQINYASRSDVWNIRFTPIFHDLRRSNNPADNIILSPEDITNNPNGGFKPVVINFFNELRSRYDCPTSNSLAVFYVPNEIFPDAVGTGGRTQGPNTLMVRRGYDQYYGQSRMNPQDSRTIVDPLLAHEIGHALFASGSSNGMDPEYTQPNDTKHNLLPMNLMNATARLNSTLTNSQLRAAYQSPYVVIR